MRSIVALVGVSVVGVSLGCGGATSGGVAGTSPSGGGSGGGSSTGGSSGGSGGSSGGSSGSGSGSGGGSSGGSSSGGSGGTGFGPMPTSAQCFGPIASSFITFDYDQYKPIINSKCTGTNHQSITGVEKVVFLGDSITEGTPPTPTTGFYRALLFASLQQKFGMGLQQADCAKWGARNGDLAGQIKTCLPGPEPLRTLVVMTSGGNDVAALAKKKPAVPEGLVQVDAFVKQLADAVHSLIDDPSRFPAGVSVIFADVYEYTDATADLSSCPNASFAGLSGEWLSGAPLLGAVEQAYVKLAVETKTDVLFLEEAFCGHGFHAADTKSQCYRGPGAETWFDLTCIHPTPTGHQVIADMFQSVVDE